MPFNCPQFSMKKIGTVIGDFSRSPPPQADRTRRNLQWIDRVPMGETTIFICSGIGARELQGRY